MWGCARPRAGLWSHTSQVPGWGQGGHEAPVLEGQGVSSQASEVQTTAIAKGRRSSCLVGAFSLFTSLDHLHHSLSCAVASPAPLSLQAADIPPAAPPCSCLSIFLPLLRSLHPPQLFLEAQSLGLMQTPSADLLHHSTALPVTFLSAHVQPGPPQLHFGPLFLSHALSHYAENFHHL